MPLNKKGLKLKQKFREEYGKERGDRILYASENKGTITGVAKKTAGKKKK